MRIFDSFRSRVPPLFSALLLLSGCTQLSAVRIRDDGLVPPAGAPYNLTFTQYNITVTRRVANCFNEAQKPLLQIATIVTASRKEVRDPKREYVIDFSQLRSFFKTTDLEIEYHENGALKSVNATVEDRSAEFLSSVFSSVAKFAIGGVGVGGEKVEHVCRDDVEKIVANLKKDEAALAAQKAEVAAITSNLERLTAMGAAMGRAWGAPERRELAAQIKAMYESKGALEKLNDDMKAKLKKISHVTNVVWPSNGETFVSKDPIVPRLTEEEISEWGTPENPAEIAGDTAVWAMLVRTSDIGRRLPCDGDKCTDDSVIGLKYRMPAPGRLLLCSQPGCDEAKRLGQDVGLISQLGPVFTLQLRNYPFMKQSVVATFNDAGQPTKLGFKDLAAAAEKAAGVFGGLVDEVLKVREAKKPKSEVERLKAETELLTAQAELAAAKKALEPAKNEAQSIATAAFTADTALLQAEITNLQARAALEAAKNQASKP